MRNHIKKIISISVLVVLFLVITTGCFPKIDDETKNQPKANSSTVTNSNENIENDASKFPTYIEDNDSEKLVIKANVTLPENFDINQKVSISSAKYVTWDRESIVSEISNGRQVVDEFLGENSGPDDIFYNYIFDDSSVLVFSLGGVSYRTKMEAEFQYIYYFDNFENFKNEDSLNKIFSNKNINGIEKSDALNSTTQIISLLDINDMIAEPQVYSMDADTMNRLQDEYDTRDKYGEKLKEWNTEQEAYLIVYPILYQNIPSSKMGAVGENELIVSSNAYFIYGRNGLISFNVSGIFDIKNTIQESYVYSPLNAIENIKNSFENIIMYSKIEISLIKLVYVIRCDFENIKEQQIEPVWLIDGKCTNFSSSVSDKKDVLLNTNYTTLISAVTGETISLISIAG